MPITPTAFFSGCPAGNALPDFHHARPEASLRVHVASPLARARNVALRPRAPRKRIKKARPSGRATGIRHTPRGERHGTDRDPDNGAALGGCLSSPTQYGAALHCDAARTQRTMRKIRIHRRHDFFGEVDHITQGSAQALPEVTAVHTSATATRRWPMPR